MTSTTTEFIQSCRTRMEDFYKSYFSNESAWAPDDMPWIPDDSQKMRARFPEGAQACLESMFHLLETRRQDYIPALAYAGLEALKTDFEMGDPPALAISMVLAQSSVLDDLRRGTPQGTESSQKLHPTATAVAGSALAAEAFALLSHPEAPALLGATTVIRLLQEVATAANYLGVTGGQMMHVHTQPKDLKQWEACARRKTMAPIKAALRCAAWAAWAEVGPFNALNAYGEAIGFAYQASEDLCGRGEEGANLGTILGRQNALEYVSKRVKEAIASLAELGANAERLHQMANELVARIPRTA